MNASESDRNLIPLDVARVRLEPRLLSPLPPVSVEDSYRIAVGGAASRAEAEQKSREIREAIGEDSQITVDAETEDVGIDCREQAFTRRSRRTGARLNDAGFDARVFQSGITPSSQSSAMANFIPPHSITSR